MGVRGWRRAVQPSFTPPPPPVPPRLDVWVTPPAYTGQAPIFLAAVDPKAGPLKLPEDSEVLAQIQGGQGPSELKLGEASVHFDTIGEGTYRATGKIVTGDHLSVVQNGKEIASWPYQLIDDEPPLVAFTRPPSESERHALRIDYAASDDYGIAKVELVITRKGQTAEATASGQAEKPGQIAKIVIELPGAGADPRAARGVAFRDLTAHPWAGTPVHLTLTATRCHRPDRPGPARRHDPAGAGLHPSRRQGDHRAAPPADPGSRRAPGGGAPAARHRQ